ncbi:MAG: decaprenyl-phosphate phosphoribosyltransferase [Candidatus Omnitrophota bacterium]|nr:decaprenyl-phosphate phosphoribosyltransferase [Candidatus Omnitrophota bacterium]
MNKYLFLSMRPQQWIKNFFIFLPLVFGQKIFSFPANVKTLFTFFLFCMITGAAYLINDAIDVRRDRLHPTKRLRPIAAGHVRIPIAIGAAVFLACVSVAAAFALNIYIGGVVLAYFGFNLLYSKILKDFVIIDVFCLGGFFLLRIIAGTFASDVVFSYWMIFMTVLLALFLGFTKRRQEIRLLDRKVSSQHRYVLSKYNTYFIDQMIAVITPSITIAYMLYTVDARTVNSFGTHYLFVSVPFVYYGIFRYLYLIHKIGKSGDPTRILLHDIMLQLDIFLWLCVCTVVIYFKI